MATSDEHERVFKPRRSHTKSRGGCLSCKKNRRKCDEKRPHCSRCLKRNVGCRYADQGKDQERQASPLQTQRSRQGQPLPTPTAWLKPSTILSAGLPDYLDCGSAASVTDTLEAFDLPLLSRYLTHTSHIIPLDEDDVYPLQVGIPNLAFESTPLMDSILALAAICRCNEITTCGQDWDQLGDLLAFADYHYTSSLRQIQDYSSDPARYDIVLANATIMVIYGAARHNVGISVRHDEVLKQMGPAPLQWAFLIRAAHMAYIGVKDSCYYEGGEELPASSASTSTWSHMMSDRSFDASADGPTAHTRYMIQPIIYATSTAALQNLESKLQTCNASPSNAAALSICSEAFIALTERFEVIRARSNAAPNHSRSNKSVGLPSRSGLSSVAPWLRMYVARVTSAIPQKPSRRLIMSFLNRVPLAFLEMVRVALDNESEQDIDDASVLAMSIFAHWLVFVTLLDGVWWIGGIGEWELSRVVGWLQRHDSPSCGEDTKWPERMLSVRRVLLERVDFEFFNENMQWE